jgi:hypothetical protein
MGYKTKSMIYVTSLKGEGEKKEEEEGKTPKKEEGKKPKPVDAGEVYSGPQEVYSGPQVGVSNGYKPTEDKGAYKSGSKMFNSSSQDVGVLAGLASGSVGTRVGTALGIITNKLIEMGVKNKAKKAEERKANNFMDGQKMTPIPVGNTIVDPKMTRPESTKPSINKKGNAKVIQKMKPIKTIKHKIKDPKISRPSSATLALPTKKTTKIQSRKEKKITGIKEKKGLFGKKKSKK